MGARLSRPGDEQQPRPRAQVAPVRVVEQVSPLPEPPPPPPRSMSPPGNVKFAGPWGVSFSGPGVVFLLGLLIAGVLAGVVYFVRGEIKSLKDELAAVEQRSKTRDEATQRQIAELRLHVVALQTYTEQSVGLTAVVVRKLGGKLEFAPGTEPDIGFHPPPLGIGRAAVAQPKAVLPAPPQPP